MGIMLIGINFYLQILHVAELFLKQIFSNSVNIMEGHRFQQLSAVTDPPPVKVSINHKNKVCIFEILL